MFWKENHYEGSVGDPFVEGRGTMLTILIAAVLGAAWAPLALLLLAAVPSIWQRFPTFWNEVIHRLAVPAIQGMLLLMALRAAAAFSREREAQTYDGLLTTSITDGEILRAKWIACVWGVRAWAVPFLVYFVLALCCGGLSPNAFVLAVVTIVIHSAFVINLGLYCSASSTSTFRAMIATLLSLVLIAGGHWLVALVTQPFVYAYYGREGATIVYNVHLWGLTLPWNLASVSFCRDDVERPDFVAGRLMPGLLGLAYYGGLALLFRWGIHRRMREFRQE